MYICNVKPKIYKIMSTQNNPTKWKKIIDLIIVLLTAIGSFIGGQASAQNGYVDMFNKQKIEKTN